MRRRWGTRGRGGLLLAALATTAGAATSGGAAPAAASVHLSAGPKLEPPFRAAATDYVSRCGRGSPLRLRVRATDGDRASVGRRRERGGTSTETVKRDVGERITIAVRTPAGAVTRYHVRCLPADFPHWTVQRHGKPQAQWYVTAPVEPRHWGYVAIFDSYGAPVWWRRSGARAFMPWDAKLLSDGLLAWGHNFGNHFGVLGKDAFEERTLGGRRVRLIRTRGSPTDLHDLQRLRNGHFLAITYRPREDVDLSAYGGPAHARVFDGVIQELTPSGGVVWQWNSRKHVSPGETGHEWWYHDGGGAPRAERGYDLLHVNSVEPDGDGLIVSARHLNAVFRIDRATGAVDWKLGGTFVAGESLAVNGVPPAQPVFSGQHDARLDRDGTLTVFDNRARTSGRPAADRFRVDPVTRTATRVAHVTDRDVTHAGWGGSARRLPGGNWVVCWGGTHVVTEQAPSGAVVLELRFGDERVTYRAQPLSRGSLSPQALRRGMDQMAGQRHG